MEVSYGDFEKSQTETFEMLSAAWKDKLHDFEAYFDLQQYKTYDVLYHIKDLTDLKDCERVMFHCIIKSAHTIFTTNRLVLSGDFGISKILMRETLEYLLVAKYVFYKNEYATDWLGGKDFSANRQIWNQLKVPDKSNLKNFWDLLCKQAHSRVSSGQIGLKGNDYDELEVSYGINLMLLRLKKHLTDLYAMLEFRLRPELYSEHYKENFTSEKVIMSYEEKIAITINEPGIELINDFCADWVFKS